LATISASKDVLVLPGVLNAGGNELILNGMMLTNSTRAPIGQVLSFPNDGGAGVGAFFGLSSLEYSRAQTYFLGFDNSTKKPSALLFAQYPSAAVAAYLRSAPIVGLTLAQLQALNTSLTVSFDGVPRTATVNLAAATSYTAVAALIQSAINGTQVSDSTFTGSIAPVSVTLNGSIAGNLLTVNSVTGGTTVGVGAALTGTGVAAGTVITSQETGTPGGPGTYGVNTGQVIATGSLTATYGLMTVTAVALGTLSVGQTVAGTGVTAGSLVTAYGTGAGLLGTYIVNLSQTVASGALQTVATAMTASFDSLSGSLVLSSGDVGATSLSGFATGPLAVSLNLTQPTGAVLSTGADAAIPGPFMAGIVAQTQNWAFFMTLFDPDGGSGNGQKLAFAQWTNSTNKRFGYICRDTDPTPTLSNAASTSLGALLAASNISGTHLVWEPAGVFNQTDAFALSIPACTDFTAINGRANWKFRTQTGLTASVTNATVAGNLEANGYNYLGAYATANQQFVYYAPGSISGPFLWADTYTDEIWLNNALQLAILNMMLAIKSIPYNNTGYALVMSACLDPIAQGLRFGAIRVGVTLSQAQAAAINYAAGKIVDPVIVQQGYYLQVLDPPVTTRVGRGSPVCNLWYSDGESINKIVLNSVVIQ